MRAVRRNNASDSFSWIGSDGWSARSLVSDGNEAEVEGTLSVQPQANPVKGFQEYFLGLNVDNNPRNPWFIGKCVLIFAFVKVILNFLTYFQSIGKLIINFSSHEGN